MDGSNKRQRPDYKAYVLNRSYTTKRQKNASTDFHGTIVKTKTISPAAIICDSGGYSIKVGNSTRSEPEIVPNCIMKAKSERKRLFVGNQIEECRDLSGLYYLLPCERGFITKWDVQKPIWDQVFHSHPVNDKPLIMTQPIFNFKSIQECMDEIFFEEYEVKSMLRTCPTDLARYQYVCERGRNVSCIVIDSGYSFTHIVPYIKGKKYYPGIKRVFVGGKLLTNYLKDILSYRKLHVMEETYVINQVKEDTCFVSQSLKDDMAIAKNYGSANSILRNYILPDFNNIRRGYVQDPDEKEFPENCQILHLNNERFTVPELLMRPSNIGMQYMGIPEAVAKCIELCPENERQTLMNNIVLIGGNANFPGYKERLYADIRYLTPCHLSLNIHLPENPIFYPWQGGKSLSRSKHFQSMVVSKYDYEEYGSKITYKKFSDWLNIEVPEPKVEIKPKKISILDNLKGVDVFGKCGDDSQETPPPRKSPVLNQSIEHHHQPLIVNNILNKQDHITLPENAAIAVLPRENEPTKTIEIKKNFIPITAIRLKSNVVSTLRFIPIGEVLKGNAILGNMKLK